MAPPSVPRNLFIRAMQNKFFFFIEHQKVSSSFSKIILIISNPVWAELDTGVYKQSVYQGERGWV